MEKQRPTVRSTYQDRPASVPLMGLGSGAVLALTLGLFVIVGLFGLWWFELRINREAEIRRDSFNFQVSAEERVLDLNAELRTVDAQLADPDLTRAQAEALGAQRVAMATDLCDTAARINDPSSDVRIIVGREC